MRSPANAIRVALIAAGFAFFSPLLANAPAQEPARRTQPKSDQVSAHQIDPDLSRVFIFVNKTGFGHQHGVEGRLKEGTLRIAKDSAGKIVFDLTSFRADTEKARRRVGLEGTSSDQEQEQVTANMLGEAVLDVAQFPTAVFTVSSVERLAERTAAGKPQYALDGEFTLHGVTKHIKVTATAEQERGFMRLQGQFPLRQTDFGIKPFKKALGAVGVADVLTVHGDFWIKQ